MWTGTLNHPRSVKPENLRDVIRALRETDAEIGSPSTATATGSVSSPRTEKSSTPTASSCCLPKTSSQSARRQIIYDVKCTRNLAGGWIRERGMRTPM